MRFARFLAFDGFMFRGSGLRSRLTGVFFEEILQNNRRGLGIDITFLVALFAAFEALFGLD